MCLTTSKTEAANRVEEEVKTVTEEVYGATGGANKTTREAHKAIVEAKKCIEEEIQYEDTVNCGWTYQKLFFCDEWHSRKRGHIFTGSPLSNLVAQKVHLVVEKYRPDILLIGTLKTEDMTSKDGYVT